MPSAKARTWGPLVRVGHWGAALLFLVAYLTAGRPLDLHARVGYLVLAYVIARVAWAVLGPASARLWSEARSPAALVGDFTAMTAGKPIRHDGLGPVGGALVVLLLATLAATAVTGVADLAVRDGQGPLYPVLGGFYVPPEQEQPHRQDIPAAAAGGAGTTIVQRTERVGGRGLDGHPDVRSGATLNAIHGMLADASLWLIVLHVAWVVSASVLRAENLILSMVTGRKHASPPVQPPPVTAQAASAAASSATADPPATQPRTESEATIPGSLPSASARGSGKVRGRERVRGKRDRAGRRGTAS
jgi:cytochrome b